MSDRVRNLIVRGYVQVSRKHRQIAALPPGKSGLEALEAVEPSLARQFLQNANQMAAEQYRRVHAERHGLCETLTEEEFNEFLVLTGRRSGQ